MQFATRRAELHDGKQVYDINWAIENNLQFNSLITSSHVFIRALKPTQDSPMRFELWQGNGLVPPKVGNLTGYATVAWPVEASGLLSVRSLDDVELEVAVLTIYGIAPR